LDVIRPGANRLVGWIAGSQYRGRQTGELGKDFAQAGASGVVPVFVPPTVFEKEQTVFDVPVMPDSFQQLLGADRVGITAVGEVPRVVGNDGAVGGNQIAINAQSDAVVRKAERLANVLGVVQIEPQSAAILKSPFFSTVSAAGLRS
jgi:hypothetical protein